MTSVVALFVSERTGYIMRKVDKLGRIVIPMELRKKYKLNEGSSVTFIDNGDGVTVIPSDPFCKICKSKISDSATIPVCDDCIKRIMKENRRFSTLI